MPSGSRAVLLPPTTVGLLEDLPRRKDSPWVFPANDRDGRFSAAVSTMPGGPSGPRPGWRTSGCTTAEHTFASRALVLGETLPVIGKLLGRSRDESQGLIAQMRLPQGPITAISAMLPLGQVHPTRMSAE